MREGPVSGRKSVTYRDRNGGMMIAQPEDAALLTPERMEDLADRMDKAVSFVRAWGIRVIDAGRLGRSASLLRRVAAAGSFPAAETELTAVAHAARDAQEFSEIAAVLPDDELKPLAVDLQQSVGGTLGVGGTTAAQYQSQLWVGAMLAHSGRPTGMIVEITEIVSIEGSAYRENSHDF